MPKQPDKKPGKPLDQGTGEKDPPDGRGERPTDPNELAAWIIRQTTGDNPAPPADDDADASEAS